MNHYQIQPEGAQNDYGLKIDGQPLGQQLAAEAKQAEAPPAPVEPERPFEEWRNFPLPEVGEIVLFIPPPGERRMGRVEFPAFVMRQKIEQHTVDLFVIFGVDDLVEKMGIPHQTASHPMPAFRKRAVEGGAPLGVMGSAPMVQEVQNAVDELSVAIYGNWERPKESMIDLLAGFEEKLKDLRKRIKVLERAGNTTG